MSLSFKSVTANKTNNNNNQNDDNLNEDENYDDDDYESADFDADDFDGNAILDDEDFADNLYYKDPEHFEYECYPIEKIDWIQEKKCEKIINFLKLENPFDAIFLLKQFKWNSQKIIDLFTKDPQHFLETYFNDNNNNNKSNTTTINNQNDKSKLDSFINIFSNNSDFFTPQNSATKLTNNKLNKETLSPSKLVLNNYCNICCTNKLELISLNDCLHCFCFECWRLHFETLISLGNTSFFECMETKCKSIASKEFVLNCLNQNSDLNVKNFNYRYRKLVTIDLINESDDLKLCPGDSKLVAISNKTTSLNNKSNEACSFIIWSKRYLLYNYK